MFIALLNINGKLISKCCNSWEVSWNQMTVSATWTPKEHTLIRFFKTTHQCRKSTRKSKRTLSIWFSPSPRSNWTFTNSWENTSKALRTACCPTIHLTSSNWSKINTMCVRMEIWKWLCNDWILTNCFVLQKISSSIEVKDNATGVVKVTYYSSCLGNGPSVQTNKCDGLKVGTVVNFTARIEVLKVNLNN